MSRHNYTQYSAKKHDNDYTTTASFAEPSYEIKMERNNDTEVEFINETVNTVSLPKTVKGTVVNCAKLNVRDEPSIDADIVCVLEVTSEIEINVEKSTDEWFNVCTAVGVEGYCMRKFINARL